MDLNDFNQFDFIDHFPEIDLKDIMPFSLRTYSLLSRNKEGLQDKKGACHIVGALDAMEGLDYHYDRYIVLEKQENEKHHIHELTAYFNRLGQFYYFTSSDFCKGLLPSGLNPKKIKELLPYRHKLTAHRAIDVPGNEPPSLRPRMAITFMHFAFHVRTQEGVAYYLPLYETSNPEANHLCFVPHEDHNIVMREAYEILERVVEKMVKDH